MCEAGKIKNVCLVISDFEALENEAMAFGISSTNPEPLVPPTYSTYYKSRDMIDDQEIWDIILNLGT